MLAQTVIDEVKNYYGKILKTNADLQTSACCTLESPPEHIKEIMKQIHPEVLEKFYGCGSPIPLAIEGATVLDLGCGTGRDVYLLSKLVGPHGKVIGVDMTDEQLAVARKYISYHTEKFAYTKPNVEFFQGYIEDLETTGIKSNSIDLVVSNCVVNLSPNKERVFAEIFRVLKPGGELYFSDVFASRRLPMELKTDSVMIGECLGGALYTEDFRRMLTQKGINDFRVVAKTKIELNNPKIKKDADHIDFNSITIRAFKLELEDRCEDYGQIAYYLGTIADCPHKFTLDNMHAFEKGKPASICSNTAVMLSQSRLAKHFKMVGDTSTHYGLFNCGPTANAVLDQNNGACC